MPSAENDAPEPTPEQLAEFHRRMEASGYTRGGPTAENDASVFIGSVALLDALYETYLAHVGIAEGFGPNGPYVWCACGWRSDDTGSDNPGESYAVHLTNAQHAAAVRALQPIVKRVIPPGKGEPSDDG